MVRTASSSSPDSSDSWSTTQPTRVGALQGSPICGFGVLIILELKFGRNKTSPAQDAWITQLRLAGQDVRVYQVEDWGNLKLAEELKQIKRNWLSTPHQHASPTTSKPRSTTREGPS